MKLRSGIMVAPQPTECPSMKGLPPEAPEQLATCFQALFVKSAGQARTTAAAPAARHARNRAG